MDKPETEKSFTSSEETSQLNRNRSFKSKQLVRSQAIRESASPPRTVSPAALVVDKDENTPGDTVAGNGTNNVTDSESRTLDNINADAASSHVSDRCSDVISFSDKVISDYNDSDECKKKQPVEIQITPGGWDVESQTEQRQRTKRWLGYKHHSDSSRDLLSNNPRVACVCGACAACPHCRGRRRRQLCPTKQDSGIVCSDDCPDCSDSEQTGPGGDGGGKTGSLDVDDQPFYCRCPERKEKPKSISLSKSDSAEEKSEPTGPDLVNFIKETLNKNGRDRMTLLKIEKELHSLVNDTGRCIVRFPVMTSYGRMLVHRCAALFQLSHHLDQTNKNSVLVSKSGTSGGRIPCTSFKQWCTTNFPPSPQRHHTDATHAKSILKRDAQSLEEGGAGSRAASRSKSLEQREREYERVRRRIFSTDNCTQDESQWPWLNSGPVKLLTPEGGRNKLVKVQSLESGGGASQSGRGRGAVSKSHSFGGYGGAEPAQPRLLSRQGDLASSSWRLSPSSSGYKTLSLRSTDSVTPSPTGGASPEPVAGGTLVWAVTDLSAVPAGALVIHPQTGRPLTNPDGSIYHFDPSNPPILYDANAYVQNDQQKLIQSCDKRRGRLEKQHSFMDNECECQPQPSEECRGKCCCECRRRSACAANIATEQVTTQPDQKSNQPQPTSPCKNRYESNPETTNHNPPQDSTTNHISPYEQPTNHRASISPNQRPGYDTSTNQTQVYDNNTRQNCDTRHYETNKRQYDNQRPPSYEHAVVNQKSTHEATNQRVHNDAVANHRAVKLTNQESVEMPQYVSQQNYQQGFRNDEIMSPPQAIPNQPFIPDMTNIQSMMAQAKIAPVPIQDPSLRPISLTNMVYPAPIPQGYPYINQCRMEPQLQPAMYQPMIQAAEEQKITSSPHATESTFRIDPSYPYAPVEYSACVEQPPPHHQPRSFNVSYGQMEMPPAALPATYPVANVMLPQPHLQHYAYQEALHWGQLPPPQPPKLLLHELCPLLPPPQLCAQYAMCPQVIPQPYPICQPIYPVLEKPPEQPRRNSFTANYRQSKRNSASSSSRNTPLTTTPEDKRDERKVPYDDNTSNQNIVTKTANNVDKTISRQNSTEIAVTIQQIKDQMAQMNTREGKNYRPREEWKRRNSGNGILGSYPVNYNGRVMGRGPNDETQLTSAARAIVNSIRSMQAKNTYNPDTRRHEYVQQQHPGQTQGHHAQTQGQWQRPDRDRDTQRRHAGQRQERDGDGRNRCQERPTQAENVPTQHQQSPDLPSEVKPEVVHDRRTDTVHRGRNVNPVPFQYRPPYLFRQMSPGTWCRRSPGPVHPALNHPRRPPPDPRNIRR